MFELFFNTFDVLIHRPLVLMVLMALPLLILAVRSGLYPSKQLLYLAALPAACSLLMVYDPTGGATIMGLELKSWILYGVLLIDALILLAALVDMFLILKARNFSCACFCVSIFKRERYGYLFIRCDPICSTWVRLLND